MARTTRLRREAWGFMIGSACFAVGAIPAYADAVGVVWGSATFFVGSIFFTLAAFIQLALSGRRPPDNPLHGADAADWWAAAIQFVGTILFNLSTVAVLIQAAASPAHELTGWRPDAWGSIAFLVSSTFALVAAYRSGELWDPLARTWHGTILNLVGSIAFGFAALGAYVLPATGDPRNLEWANLGTFLGAVCFFVAAALAKRNIAPAPARWT